MAVNKAVPFPTVGTSIYALTHLQGKKNATSTCNLKEASAIKITEFNENLRNNKLFSIAQSKLERIFEKYKRLTIKIKLLEMQGY